MTEDLLSLDLRSSLEGIEFPPMLTGTAASLVALLAALERTERMDAGELERRQLGQLARLAEHAAARSKHFAERLERARLLPSDLGNMEGLRALPPLTRRDVQRAGDALFCEPPPSHLPIVEARTSGSTGEPVVVRQTGATQLLAMALSLREHRWHARDASARLSSVRANISAYVELASWGPPMSLLARTGPAQGIPIATPIAEQLELLMRFAPDVLLVYPTTLAALAREAEARGARVPSLRCLRTMGETLTPSCRADAERVFGARVEDSYSSNELGAIAHECPEARRYHVMSERHVVEVVDDRGAPCPPGEMGRVLVTDLTNFATPLVRYAIGDYAIAGGACPCGRTSPTLERVVGRERNLVVMPDGSRRWPLVGFARFRDVAPVAQYQLVQRSRETIEVRLACDAAMSGAQEADLAEVIREALGHPFELTFTIFEGDIPRGPSGKFEEFVCLVET